VHLTIIRDGKQSEVSATLVEHPNPPKKEESSSNEEGSSSASQILDGVQATAMTTQIARQLQLPADTKGVVLMEVAPGSAAADAGLKRGDVILEVNRKPIATVEQFAQSVSHAGKQPVMLFIKRGGRTIYAVLHGGS